MISIYYIYNIIYICNTLFPLLLNGSFNKGHEVKSHVNWWTIISQLIRRQKEPFNVVKLWLINWHTKLNKWLLLKRLITSMKKVLKWAKKWIGDNIYYIYNIIYICNTLFPLLLNGSFNKGHEVKSHVNLWTIIAQLIRR